MSDPEVVRAYVGDDDRAASRSGPVVAAGRVP